MNKNILLLILLLSMILNVLALNLDYKLEKPSQLYIGTPFKLKIDITTSLTDSIFAPRSDTLDIFVLRDIQQTETLTEGKKISHVLMTFQPFDTGEHTFPVLEFTVKTDQDLQILKTSEFQLHIKSVIADSSQVIRDIADPVILNLGIWDYLLPIVVIVMILIFFRYLRRYLYRRKSITGDTPVRDDRPPYLIALELLKSLSEKNLLTKGDFLEFFFALSYILRLFLELEFKIKAVEMTTSEIRQDLFLDDHKEKSAILGFLSGADRIKFAKFIPTLEEATAAMNWLEDYLYSYQNKALKTDSEVKNA
ncbi:MAG: hypothetical protein JXB60_08255 [Candidatus Cloacimonetes bacterium]|nr:hypothetical protein [Candidatus Cloacimonadota bacterium]